VEDRPVLETAWAGQADMLVTANLVDFIQDGDREVVEGKVYRLRRCANSMLMAHPFEAIRWLQEDG
jgi:hypothetical protein